MAAKDPVALVTEFLEGFGKSSGQDIANVRAYLADDIEFHTGTRALSGLAEVVDHLQATEQNYGIATWKARMRHIAADGNRVFNERWDDLYDSNGEFVVTTALASVFEVEGDRITVWRDYFNPDELRAAMAERSFKMKY